MKERMSHQLPTQSAGLWHQFSARVRSWFEVPYGYEDENGFHFGDQPVPLWAKGATGQRVATDRACDVMTYPAAIGEVIESTPDVTPAPVPQLKA